MDLDAYFERVGLGVTPAASLEGLEQVQSAQLRSMPFESFDLHLDRDIPLAIPALFDKLVVRRRGGYCFELNGLLAQVLQRLGLRLQPHLARVIFGREVPGPLTHQVLLVHVDGAEWLVDAGFGGPGLRAPMRMQAGHETSQDRERFRLREDPALGLVLEKLVADRWMGMYAIEARPAWPQDIEMANFYMSRHPASYFRLNRVAVLQTANGRVTLLNRTLCIEDASGSVESTVSDDAYLTTLRGHFGIALDVPHDALRAMRP
jgi:N-hydroxyarylamine O-acetyltransferase